MISQPAKGPIIFSIVEALRYFIDEICSIKVLAVLLNSGNHDQVNGSEVVWGYFSR